MAGEHDDILLAVGKLSGAAESVQKSLDRFSSVLDKHDSRLSEVEKKQSKYAGYAAGIGAAGGAILTALAKKAGLN